MQKKKVLLLANETSGVNSAVNEMFEIVKQLSLRNCLVTVYPIVPKEGLVSEDILLSEAENYDVIACVGGDGTLNHLINTIMHMGLHKTIGYFPTGSTNDFFKSLNQGKNLSLKQKCRAVSDGKVFAYDVGKINEEYFNYVAAFGAFTKVSYDTPQDLKNAIGYGAYVLNVIGNIPEGLSYRQHVKYTCNGVTDEGDFIFGAVSNTRSVAGVQSKLISNSALDDGEFEVILISAPNNLLDVNVILNKMLSGNTDDTHIIKLTASSITFEFDEEVIWTLDGEESRPGKTADITCCNKAVNMLIHR